MQSSGEKRIAKILKSSGIIYDREVKFSKLTGSKSIPLRFDFAIYNQFKQLQCLIEFQGMQHYKYTSIFHKTRSDFLKAQERDRKKIRFCIINNIPLYLIPAWEEQNINTIYDLLNPKFHALNQYHNDQAWQRYEKRQKGY